MPLPFSGSASSCARHRHARAKQRRQDFLAEQRLVALVIRMRHKRHACGQQLGARRFDLDRSAVRTIEPQPVIRPFALAIFELGLRHGGAEIHVPQRRRLELIRETVLQQMHESNLRYALRPLVDRRVGHRPVDRQTQVAPQVLERLLVFLRQPQAELDEIRARDRNRLLRRLWRRLKIRVVRQRRIAAHAVVVLHAALGRQPVVVPSHRIEHLAAAHPLKARDDVSVGVRKHVADVQRSADGRRRRVDRKDLVAWLGAIERDRCRPPPIAAAISSRAPRAQVYRERAAVTVCSIADNGTTSVACRTKSRGERRSRVGKACTCICTRGAS